MSVALRSVSRGLLEKARWGLDDVLLSLVWYGNMRIGGSNPEDNRLCVLPKLVNFARAIYVSFCIRKGFGQHLHVLLEEDPIATTKLLRLLVILQTVGLWTFTLPKLPVAVLLVRLFGTTTKRLAQVLYFLVGFLLLWTILVSITAWAQCQPAAAQWDLRVKGTCWNKAINVDLGYFLGGKSQTMCHDGTHR